MEREESTGSIVKNVARDVAGSTERIFERAGEAASSMGDTLRQGIQGGSKVTESVTRSVKQTAEYVQEEGVSGMVEDLEVLIRRYPLQTLLLGMGCGYLLSRLRPE
jgi:hypothetical protein